MRQIINNTPSGSGLGDTLYSASTKINAMTEEIYSILGSISGSLAKTSEFTNDGEDGTKPLLDTTSTITISKVTDLQTQLDTLQENIDTVVGNTNTNTEAIESLQTSVNELSGTVTTILNTLTAQQNLITAIQGDIADIYNIINV